MVNNNRTLIIALADMFTYGLRAQLGDGPTDAPHQIRDEQVERIYWIANVDLNALADEELDRGEPRLVDCPRTEIISTLDKMGLWVCDREGVIRDPRPKD